MGSAGRQAGRQAAGLAAALMVAVAALGCRDATGGGGGGDRLGTARSAVGGTDPCALAVPDSPLATAYVDELRARFRIPVGPFPLVKPWSPLTQVAAPAGDAALIGESAVDCLVQQGAFLVPVVAEWAGQGITRSIGVELPASSAGAVRIADATSGASVWIRLHDALVASVEIASGYVLYRAVIDGANLVTRVDAAGVEDFLVWETPPSQAELLYDIGLEGTSVGLRLVGNALEVLDGDGTPCLRLRAPVVLTQSGERRDGHVEVEGCSYDNLPAPPWGRPVTQPGSSGCILRVTWNDGLPYPAVVDPAWTATGSMAGPRTGHAAVALADGRVLVAGGSKDATTLLSSAEIYDPISSTWAVTSSMTAARDGLAAVLLSTTNKVLVVGGAGDQGPVATAELWDPAGGAWAGASSMSTARVGHTATALPDGRALVAGGYKPISPTEALDTAEVYAPLAGTWSPTALMSSARASHAATLLPTGRVLVAGGNGGRVGGNTIAYASAELYDPASNHWSLTGSMSTERSMDHALVVLGDGSALVTGGMNPADGLLASAERYASGGWTTAGNMSSPRGGHTATVIGGDLVLVAGGNTQAGGNLASSQLYGATTNLWYPAATMTSARTGHTATLLAPNGPVLAAGGYWFTGPNVGAILPTAELFTLLPSALTCQSGLGDCDGDPQNGCETSVTTTQNCGGCGIKCWQSGVLNAACNNGACSGTCVANWADCNNDIAADGCEAYLPGDPANCGSCGAVCNPPHVSASNCSSGNCIISGCSNQYEWANCNGSGWDGCETSLHDPVNCGGCGVVCSANHISSLSCTYGSCDGACESGWVDCNFDKQKDGCESLEVDFCGACTPGYVCSSQHITRHCTSGVCDGTCDPGYADCNNDKRKDGCETPLSDIVNCGECGHECSQSTMDGAACVGGKCMGMCKQGMVDCNGDKDKDGCEVTISSDPSNCGGCGAACSENHVALNSCRQGQCNGLCAQGYADCNGNKRIDGCEKAQTDGDFCGLCAAIACNDGLAFTKDDCQPVLGCVHSSQSPCGNGKCDFGEDPCPATCGSCNVGCAADCADSDGDGLPDAWETGPVDVDGDGDPNGPEDLNLAALGANPSVKDIFVELDYMVAPDHIERPSDAELAAFAQPFQAQGINLHVFVDEALPHHAVVLVGPPTNYTSCAFADAVSYSDIWQTHMKPARRGVFRYALAAHSYSYSGFQDYCTPTATGGMAVPPYGFIVVNGAHLTFAPPLPTYPLLHELGHDLGLRHGGGDDFMYKPNYFSDMNVGGGSLTVGLPSDYSHHKLPTLDENNLNEAAGVQSPDPAYVRWSCPQQCVSATICPDCQGTCGNPGDCICQTPRGTLNPITNEAVDWNCNGFASDTGVHSSINHMSSADDDPAIFSLQGFDDWANLQFSTCGAGYLPYPVTSVAPADDTHLWVDATSRAGRLPIPVSLEVSPPEFTLGSIVTIQVSVLSAIDFDPRRINPLSIQFALASPVATQWADVNGDGASDLLGEFSIHELYLIPASTHGVLTGTLTSGDRIQGEATIVALPPAAALVPVAKCGGVVANAQSDCLAAALINVGSHDQDGDTLTLTQSPPGPYPLGTTAVTLSVADGTSTSTCTGSVTVVDRSPPSLSCPPHTWLECDHLAGTATFAPTAFDNCDAPTVSCDPPSPATLPLGDKLVMCAAADSAGNRSECGFLLTVTDTQPPVLPQTLLSHLFVDQPPVLTMYKNLSGHEKQTFAYPFKLTQCVTTATDGCFGDLSLDGTAKIARIEWWPRTPSGKGSDTAGLMHSRLTHFANHGCDHFAIKGAIDAALPVVDLDNDGGSFYAVYFTVTDPFGNAAQAMCELDLLGTQADAGKPLGSPLGCGVCVGEGCGSCPSPVQACP